MAHSPLDGLSWRPGTDPLRLDPSVLCGEGAGDGRPRLAKDEAYASAVSKAWSHELAHRPSSVDDIGSISSPLVYKCEGDGSTLHGHIYRPSTTLESPRADDDSRPPPTSLLPGVILFHTGAGPQDIFLRWKADSLVNKRDTFGDSGCVVLIADIIGDRNGWAWHDRERYDAVRKSILVPDDKGERPRLVARVRAAVDTLVSQPGVDPRRVLAMGFCLGGHPVLELARMQLPSVRAMATFHGVFDCVRELSSIKSHTKGAGECHILVCTGEDDPFVPDADLDGAMDAFQSLGCQSNLMKFQQTRHGFTNPAQDYNPSEAFAYDEEANARAWSAALSLFKSELH